MHKFRDRRKPQARGARIIAWAELFARLVTAVGIAIIAGLPLHARWCGNAESTEVSLAQQRDAAVHEAGHAVISHLISPRLPLSLEVRVRLAENGTYLGLTRRETGTAKDPKDEALWRLGGLAAEEVFLGNAPPANYEDKDRATEQLMHTVCRSQEDCPCTPELLRGEAKICLLVDRAMNELNAKLYPKAKALILSHQSVVGALADRIMLQEPRDGARQLTAREVAAFFKEYPVAPQRVASKE